MTKHLPLTTLIELAHTKADEATRLLGNLQTAKSSAASKLDMLLQYRQEYLDQLREQMYVGVASAQIRNFQLFITTLDAAIEQQRSVMIQADSRLAAGRSDWQHCRRRLSSLDTLADRARQQVLLALNKREQKDNDERTSRRFHAARNTNFGPLA